MGARTASQLIAILSTVIALSSSFRSSEAMGAALYWGQRPTEVSLKAVCDTGLFAYINLAYLIISDDGPALNLDGHCDPDAGTCRDLNAEVHSCQEQGIKVLLSIQISGNRPPVSSSGLASYIMRTFLNGNPYGPLGNVSLDGVDFHVKSPAPANQLYWKDVADILSRYSEFTRKIYLAAAPLCHYPDSTLNVTIQSGIIDYVWLQFYNNPTCDYSGGGGINNVLGSWNEWSLALPERSQLFMGLPTDPGNVQSGYIPLQTIPLCILSKIRPYENYGGFMLWNVSFLDVDVCKVPEPVPHIKLIAESF